ncbi:hypothetical protein TRIUR3_16391 [Triticum urartu]|uniref:Uncharacterized protein n=1 Tax=Triticum urartu TaxID=4572 RepID=M7ZZJ4_TRIUA|nr:hypothetical protein TRIUR3_16391 [Triticum urartu]
MAVPVRANDGPKLELPGTWATPDSPRTPGVDDAKAVAGAPVGDVLVDLRRKIEGFGPSRTPDSDFTPSRGSTPVHQPRAQTVMSNVFLPDNAARSPNSSEASPTGRRKLADLLQEATRNDTGETAAAAAGEADVREQGQPHA